jgi:hypothetical protein
MMPEAAAGLGGHGAAHHEVLWFVMLGVFLALVLGLWILYSRSATKVEAEQVDAILREHETMR